VTATNTERNKELRGVQNRKLSLSLLITQFHIHNSVIGKNLKVIITKVIQNLKWIKNLLKFVWTLE
jgi:hypothetical protein